MKCPYMCKQVQQTRQHKPDIVEYLPTDDNIPPAIISGNDSDIIIYEMMTECLKEDCAAFQGGHCVRTA